MTNSSDLAMPFHCVSRLQCVTIHLVAGCYGQGTHLLAALICPHVTLINFVAYPQTRRNNRNLLVALVTLVF